MHWLIKYWNIIKSQWKLKIYKGFSKDNYKSLIIGNIYSIGYTKLFQQGVGTLWLRAS